MFVCAHTHVEGYVRTCMHTCVLVCAISLSVFIMFFYPSLHPFFLFPPPPAIRPSGSGKGHIMQHPSSLRPPPLPPSLTSSTTIGRELPGAIGAAPGGSSGVGLPRGGGGTAPGLDISSHTAVYGGLPVSPLFPPSVIVDVRLSRMPGDGGETVEETSVKVS